jgi:hypothetical protein
MKIPDLPTRIFLTVAYLAMVVVNYLANSLPLNGRQTGEISDAYANLFAPAGITFSIWGVIYALLALQILYQWGLFHQNGSSDAPLLRRVGILFGLSSLANTGWVFAWHYDQILLSTVLIVTILVLLAAIAVTLRDRMLDARQTWFVRVPFSVYFGWLTVATVANITVLLVSAEWDGFGIDNPVWAVAVILVAASIGCVTLIRNRDMAYGLVLVWAFTGIVIKHASADGFGGRYWEVIATALASIVAFVVAEVFVWRKLRR